MSLDADTKQKLFDIANRLRIHSVESTSASNSGHPSSCSSMAEITSVLFFNTMKYNPKEPRHPTNDRFVLSKGHAAPILYAAWAEAGLFPASDLKNLRKIDCDLEGHPTPVDVVSKFYLFFYCYEIYRIAELIFFHLEIVVYRCGYWITWSRFELRCWHGLYWKVF